MLGIQKKDGIFFVSTKSKKVYESISVIITSGAESKLINVPGEEEFSGKGVSYCSLCDGPIFKDKIVAVVGGGNNGFESALFLSNYVKKIFILEFSDKVKADQENQDLVFKNKNIEVITNAKVVKIEGKVFVNSITYEDLKNNKEITLEVNGVFVEIGYTPSTLFVGDLVDLNEKGEIVFDPENLKTKTPGLFSAGDCNVSKYKQIVMASGEGAKAALSAYEYIKRNK
ncbi:MAG: Alkyl hydroperoxide reductase subunit F [Parcubacteria group bacterium GW2011_GWA2_33_14]|nr:MAG: Alkyl hydroperoxide reductase subunit F [Parcubacteria group bacterium GW2011_GWA2_33_14]